MKSKEVEQRQRERERGGGEGGGSTTEKLGETSLLLFAGYIGD